MFKDEKVMEQKLTPKQRARLKYEILHKAERDQATKQFNTRLPVKEYDEITAFLKEKGIAKVFHIRFGLNQPLQYLFLSRKP